MWAATLLLLFGVALVAGTPPGWWVLLGCLCLVFVPALIIDAVERGAR